ncbi:beta-glucosidase [Nonomuraea solani]|uniref:beta-glucosidase n=1 Tax=Nonomuraea solani TaxID=1144553 RepID=A0A1H6F0T9_9ACTN|nr:glycoside hydrolase family 3 N-terminal domain-containing protein [Nonomuraea solani]SEH02981.1 beta-glucosidase [Nonomuraea solani]
MSEWLVTSQAPDGTVYRDLNGNGVMDPYEDPRLPVAQRVRDLISRMTVEEKAGQFFHPMIEAGQDGSPVETGAMLMPHSTSHTIQRQFITHFNVIMLPGEAKVAALWHNRVQKLAEQTRLGIPVTISTDPCHSGGDNLATSMLSGAFSRWPEAMGLAALRDVDAVREFARIARQEYRAIGIRSALHPQIDLATEPRWARQSGTFGPSAELTTAYVRAYLEGFQGESLDATSVACMTKHFPGGGPQKDGEDPHFPYGREQVYPGGLFDHHLQPFLEAIDAGTSAIMPYYGMPVGAVHKGRAIEEVGFGFNKGVITGILREDLGYDGVVCTDWQLVTDSPYSPARAWGVEHLSRAGRVARILDAGCDQLGGEECTDVLLSLVEDGTVPESRLDESLARLLAVKFELGLFDDPYAEAPERAGTPEAVTAGFDVQVGSLVLLKNDGLLPLAPTARVYVEGGAFPEGVDRPEEADVIVVRLDAPFEQRDGMFLEPYFHAGSLDFAEETVARVRELAAIGPVIVDVKLERPAVLTPLADLATAIVGSFGSGNAALAHALVAPGAMRGRLPFQLPRSMTAVERNQADVPNDLDDVLFPEGFGLEYK